MPRKTDSNNPADWLWIAAIDLSAIEHLARETAEVLGISEATAHRDWEYARAWLHEEIEADRKGTTKERQWW